MISESGIDETPLPDELLLCFIRYRNQNLIRALKALKDYIRFKESYPHLMTNLKPSCPKNLVDSIFNRMSSVPDKHGRYVYLVPIGRWRDDLCSLEDVVRVCLHDLQISLCHISTQTAGGVCIIDFKNFGIRKMKDMTPAYLGVLINILQGAFPMKIKGIHLVHHSRLVNVIMAMAWPFLSKKLRGRVHLHSNFASLHKMIDPASLPSDYDGHLGPISEMPTTEEVIKPTLHIFNSLEKYQCNW